MPDHLLYRLPARMTDCFQNLGEELVALIPFPSNHRLCRALPNAMLPIPVFPIAIQLAPASATALAPASTAVRTMHALREPLHRAAPSAFAQAGS